MQVFDLGGIDFSNNIEPAKEVFFESSAFSARVVSLPPGAQIPPCEMSAYVLFYVVDGEAEVTVNSEKAVIATGQCLISEPATLAMRTKDGARILGIQVALSR
jgi:mannose-6-phosphate isomerase-like protein (cupin superfamily)